MRNRLFSSRLVLPETINERILENDRPIVLEAIQT
jgi:hypothetical protein